jgi:hypothetical protein
MRRIKRVIAWIALVALAWPSLGALPWLAQPTQAHAAGHVHAHGTQPHRHIDPSTIPGSPTHPVDHNCFECQVLQHLARCIFAATPAGIVPPILTCDAAPRVAIALPRTHVAMVLPHARAPPSSII